MHPVPVPRSRIRTPALLSSRHSKTASTKDSVSGLGTRVCACHAEREDSRTLDDRRYGQAARAAPGGSPPLSPESALSGQGRQRRSG